MTHQEARRYLQRNPDTTLELVTKDATLTHFVRHLVWLDEDGDLVQSHPTSDLPGAVCAAPIDGEYH